MQCITQILYWKEQSRRAKRKVEYIDNQLDSLLLHGATTAIVNVIVDEV